MFFICLGLCNSFLSIHNKLGGVLALYMSIFILYFMLNNSKLQGMTNYPMNQIMFWYMLIILILLTWIGAPPVELPYVNMGMLLIIVYFVYYIMDPMIKNSWYEIINENWLT